MCTCRVRTALIVFLATRLADCWLAAGREQGLGVVCGWMVGIVCVVAWACTLREAWADSLAGCPPVRSLVRSVQQRAPPQRGRAWSLWRQGTEVVLHPDRRRHRSLRSMAHSRRCTACARRYWRRHCTPTASSLQSAARQGDRSQRVGAWRQGATGPLSRSRVASPWGRPNPPGRARPPSGQRTDPDTAVSPSRSGAAPCHPR